MLSHATIEVTGRCNLTCRHCYADVNENIDLPPDVIEIILEQLAELGTRSVVLSGGEPLMREDIEDIIDAANSYNINPSISTNGTIYSSALMDCNIRDIQVSIDGFENKHDALRGKYGAFKEAVENIALFRRDGHNVIINSTIYKQNLVDVPKLIDLALELGADGYRALLLMPVGRGKNLEALMPDEAVDFAKYMARRRVELRGKLDIGMPQSYVLLKGERTCCNAGRETICIKTDGNITPCEFLPDVVIWNVRKDRLKGVLNGKQYDSCPALMVDGKSIYGEMK